MKSLKFIKKYPVLGNYYQRMTLLIVSAVNLSVLLLILIIYF